MNQPHRESRGYRNEHDCRTNQICDECKKCKASGNGTATTNELTKVRLVLIFSGNYNPKKDKLELIADALDININWLMGENVPMENISATDNQTTGYVFYKEMEYLLNNTDTAYIGFQTQYGALIPRYQIYVNVSLNEMHIVPIFLREDQKSIINIQKNLLNQNHMRYLQGIFQYSYDNLPLLRYIIMESMKRTLENGNLFVCLIRPKNSNSKWSDLSSLFCVIEFCP